jgi:CRISPR-associated protein Csb2
MLAIEVEFLLGRSVATDTTRRDRAEWPPHPTRLFSALVDALYDVADDEARGRAEAALRWMEAEPAPEIAASLGESEVSERLVMPWEERTPRAAKHFVPINDEPGDPKNPRAAQLGDLRTRQERFFPAVVPSDPVVVFAWPRSEPSQAHLHALADLAARVPYLGHSSSLVRVSLRRDPVRTRLRPVLAGGRRLRVPGPGRLDRLNEVFAARREDTLVQPPRGREVAYSEAHDDALPAGPHGDVRVLAWEGAVFDLGETAWLTTRLREALLSKLPDGVASPEVLTGHTADGAPARRHHLAFVTLANVSERPGRYADGSVKGFAVLVPRDIDDNGLLLLDTALARISRLVFGQRGDGTLRPTHDEWDARRGHEIFSLNAKRYTDASTTWVTVTPIALGRHPKPAKGVTAEVVIAQHLRELGLPQATEIATSTTSRLFGAPLAGAFHRGNLASLQGRLLRHAQIRFAEPVRGPLVVGAGRHMGFGLLMAMERSS